MFIHTTKPIKPGFCKTPEALNAIDVGAAPDKFVLSMIDSQMLAIADIDQAIVA